MPKLLSHISARSITSHFYSSHSFHFFFRLLFSVFIIYLVIIYWCGILPCKQNIDLRRRRREKDSKTILLGVNCTLRFYSSKCYKYACTEYICSNEWSSFVNNEIHFVHWILFCSRLIFVQQHCGLSQDYRKILSNSDAKNKIEK